HGTPSTGVFAQGNYDVSVAIDPQNPNVLYIGGTDDGALDPAGGMIRVDVTTMSDVYAFVTFDNSDADGGKIQSLSDGPAKPTDPTKPDDYFSSIYCAHTDNFFIIHIALD